MDLNHNGAVLWRGPSLLDGAPIVVIATGLAGVGANRKTGALIQTWILRADMLPTEAVASGADASICGDCRHRGDGTGKGRSCYVSVFQAPQNIWRTWQRGRYSERAPRGLGKGRKVRIGSYGDPAAVPVSVWLALLDGCDRVQTGYTHQWRRAPELAPFCMASVDSLDEAAQARALGFRTFRVSAHVDPQRDEILCPASEEAGKRTTCASCGLCAGNKPRAKHVMIPVHGGVAVVANGRRNLAS